jgi:hypothetical protein
MFLVSFLLNIYKIHARAYAVNLSLDFNVAICFHVSRAVMFDFKSCQSSLLRVLSNRPSIKFPIFIISGDEVPESLPTEIYAKGSVVSLV